MDRGHSMSSKEVGTSEMVPVTCKYTRCVEVDVNERRKSTVYDGYSGDRGAWRWQVVRGSCLDRWRGLTVSSPGSAVTCKEFGQRLRFWVAVTGVDGQQFRNEGDGS